MTYIIGLASLMSSLYIVLTMHPFESGVANFLSFMGLNITYMVLLFIAGNLEDKANKRIKALEDKLKDKEEHK